MNATECFIPIIEQCYQKKLDLLSNKALIIRYKWSYEDDRGKTPLYIMPRQKTFFDPGKKSEVEMIELTTLLTEIKIYYGQKNVLFVMTWYYNPTGFKNGVPKSKKAYDSIMANSKRFLGEMRTTDFKDASLVKRKFTLLFNQGLKFFSLNH